MFRPEWSRRSHGRFCPLSNFDWGGLSPCGPIFSEPGDGKRESVCLSPKVPISHIQFLRLVSHDKSLEINVSCLFF